MFSNSTSTRELFQELKPGDRIEVEHTESGDDKNNTTRTVGRVIRIEWSRHEPGAAPNRDQPVPPHVVLLELPEGELTSLTLDKMISIRWA